VFIAKDFVIAKCICRYNIDLKWEMLQTFSHIVLGYGCTLNKSKISTVSGCTLACAL